MIQEAYSHLKERLMDTFAKQASPDARLCAEVALKEYEKDHKVWKEPLRKALAIAGIEQDQEIIQTAQKILQEGAPVPIHAIGDTKKRPLGILKGKASFKINGDFKITDDELLSS